MNNLQNNKNKKLQNLTPRLKLMLFVIMENIRNSFFFVVYENFMNIFFVPVKLFYEHR